MDNFSKIFISLTLCFFLTSGMGKSRCRQNMLKQLPLLKRNSKWFLFNMVLTDSYVRL